MITLAIETAIRGGSLSLLKDDLEIDFRIGNKEVSKAEDVLEKITEIIKTNREKKIDLLVVSNGPGSSTGIRIGWATALGLRKAFGCGIVGVSILEAITFNKTFDKPALIAIPAGSRQIAWHLTDIDNRPQINQQKQFESADISSLFEILTNKDAAELILHRELAELMSDMSDMSDKIFEKNRIKILENNLARLIGLKGKQLSTEYASDNKKPVSLMYNNFIM